MLPETHVQAFPGALENVSPERFQKNIFKHFQAQARMKSRKLPETHFQAFPGAGQNVSLESF